MNAGDASRLVVNVAGAAEEMSSTINEIAENVKEPVVFQWRREVPRMFCAFTGSHYCLSPV